MWFLHHYAEYYDILITVHCIQYLSASELKWVQSLRHVAVKPVGGTNLIRVNYVVVVVFHSPFS